MEIDQSTAHGSAVDSPKGRRREGPRAPTRKGGVARYAALLDATDALLRTESPDSIGLYQIAKEAGVPAPSVYHFFPTKEAAYMALAERYCDELLEVHRTPIEARLLRNWPDLTRIDMRRAADFYNRNPPALKIIYGGFGGVEARNIDKLLAIKLANAAAGRLNRVFHLPFIRDAAKKSEVAIALLDAVWTISVRHHGFITDDYFEESYRATLAYRRLYLPEYLEPREALTSAVESGGVVILPFDDEAGDARPGGAA